VEEGGRTVFFLCFAFGFTFFWFCIFSFFCVFVVFLSLGLVPYGVPADRSSKHHLWPAPPLARTRARHHMSQTGKEVVQESLLE